MIIEDEVVSDKHIRSEVHCGVDAVVIHDCKEILVFSRTQATQLIEVLQRWVDGEEIE